ncbi:MAG TPA: HEAT repeat domain-containing protein, partial [Longimicrobium sp.]|nr:HEAT repeat domain-containing protein [Longimicrobium sp.]
MLLRWLRSLVGRVRQLAVPLDTGPIVPPVDERNAWWVELLVLLDQVGAAPTADAAARTLRDRLRTLDAARWVRADDQLRGWLWSYEYSRSLGWLGGEADVRRLAVPPETEAAVFGLLASHSSGFVREAAVRRLALVGDGGEMPPLLLRANDRVPQVRGRAVEALHARLVPAYAGAWVRWVGLALRLGGPGREDVRPLLDAVMALLRSPEAEDAVWTGLRSPQKVVRRTCFGILERAGGPGLRRLAEESLRGEDVVIRRGAARVAGALDDASLAAVLPGLVRDPLPQVRRDALALAAERVGADALPWLREALLDRSAGVRAEARAALQRLAPMDFAAFYREQVSGDGARLAAAVAGLADTGGGEDVELVRPLLDHPRPRVRAAAVRAVARLGGRPAVPAVLAAVRDANRSVSRAAAMALRDAAGGIGVGQLGTLYLDSAEAHVRQNALSLLIARGKWQSIPWILRAL